MMDLSSVIDATLTIVGAIAVVLMGIATLSSDSTSAFTAPNLEGESVAGHYRQALDKAA